MTFTSESARAAGLKSAANRTPEVQARVTAARWGADHERKSARPVELPKGPVRTYWIDVVAARYPDEFGEMSSKAIVRRATLLARAAAAEAAVAADNPGTPKAAQSGPRDAFGILYAKRHLEAGARDE